MQTTDRTRQERKIIRERTVSLAHATLVPPVPATLDTTSVELLHDPLVFVVGPEAVSYLQAAAI